MQEAEGGILLIGAYMRILQPDGTTHFSGLALVMIQQSFGLLSFYDDLLLLATHVSEVLGCARRRYEGGYWRGGGPAADVSAGALWQMLQKTPGRATRRPSGLAHLTSTPGTR